MSRTEEKIDFFVRTSLPPIEGIFHNGQIFDAYKFATDLIRSAKKSILLIDNYVDESVLLMLSKRNAAVKADIYADRHEHAVKKITRVNDASTRLVRNRFVPILAEK